MPYTDHNPEAEAMKVHRPTITVIVTPTPGNVINASTTMRFPSRRDGLMDLLAVEQFLRKLGYREVLKAPPMQAIPAQTTKPRSPRRHELNRKARP